MKLRSKMGAPLMFAAAWILAQTVGSAATFSVTPSAISNTCGGVITLQIGGLANGESVRVEKFVDANTNGAVDASDVLVQSFLLTDGQATTIGGITNINVPGDYAPAAGTILTPLNIQAGGLGQALSGQYAYILSSPTAQFTPVTNIFNVTNSNYAQSFAGNVLCNGTNVPYATILLFTPPTPNGGMNFIAGTIANGSGGYSISAPAGTYMLLASRAGYVVDLATAPVLTLGAGATIDPNLSLLAATRSVSGKIVDLANTSQGLPAMMIICESDTDTLALGFADANGNFTVPVTDGQWRAGTDDGQPAFYGYLRLSDKGTSVNTTTGNVSGVSIALPKSTALIYGSVKDAQNNPLAGIGLYASQNNGNGPYDSDATTDQSGKYVLGIGAGTWQAGVDNNSPALANYIFSGMDNTNVLAGQALLRNFIGLVATNHITGFVRDGGGNPITNINVYGRADINGTTFYINANTDSSGAYSLTAGSGTWNLGVDCQGLNNLGFPCIGEKTANVLNGDVVVNFVVSSLQVTTTSLPDATQDVFYSQQLNATAGQTPYVWSLSPGSASLPGGLTLTTNGVLSGTPTGNNQFNFSVRVTDNQGATADQMLSLYINPAPLQITTVSLPDGTNGQFYSQQCNATGGQPPYNWYLPNGSISLPPGLNFNNGLLSGTPTTNGVFNFDVAVYVNNPYQVSTRSLSVTIAVAPPTNAPTVTLTAPGRSSGGGFQFSFNTSPGWNYTVQSSSNLTTWTPVLTVGGSGSPMTMTNSDATDGKRFYRVKVGL